MQKKRVVLIEDETLFRQLIRLTLGKVKELEVVAEFGTAREGIAYCQEEKPDLLVTDLMLPDLEGTDLIRAVRAALPDTKVMLLTGHPGGRLPSELLSLGIEAIWTRAARWTSCCMPCGRCWTAACSSRAANPRARSRPRRRRRCLRCL